MPRRVQIQKWLKQAIRSNEHTYMFTLRVLDITPREEYPEHYQYVSDVLTLIAMLDRALSKVRELY
jgi:hypothetical protein